MTDEEKKQRKQAIQEATKYAIEIPFSVMQVSFKSMAIIKAMVQTGNPNSITDAGVGALCARSAIIGAFMNVKVNSLDYEDKIFTNEIIAKGEKIQDQAIALEAEIIEIVNQKFGL